MSRSPAEAANPWHGVTDATSARAHLDTVQAETLKQFTARRAALQSILDAL